MKIIKEKLIGTYVFSIDEATVKGDYRGDIWYQKTLKSLNNYNQK